MFNQLSKIRPQVEYKFWASIGHEGQTLDDLEVKMTEIGNTVIARDEENQRLLVALAQGTGEDVWGCTICLNQGSLTICDTYDELEEHCDNEHEGWREHGKT